jgi:hypothetical protein
MSTGKHLSLEEARKQGQLTIRSARRQTLARRGSVPLPASH